MSDSNVSLELTPESVDLLGRWATDKMKAAADLSRAWLDRVSAWVVREALLAFSNSKAPGGKTWPENKGRYAEWKRAVIGQTKPGFLTGALRGSVSTEIDHAAGIARIGSPLQYAKDFHDGNPSVREFIAHGPGGNTGGPFRVNGTPARPFLPEAGAAQRHGYDLLSALLAQKVTS